MAKSTIVNLPQMVDLALNSPEIGVVNFTVLHALLHVMVQQLSLSDLNVEFRGNDSERLQTYMENAKPGPIITLTEYVIDKEGKEKMPATDEDRSEKTDKEVVIIGHAERVDTSALKRDVEELKTKYEILLDLPNNEELIREIRKSQTESGTLPGLLQGMVNKAKLESLEEMVKNLTAVVEFVGRDSSAADVLAAAPVKQYELMEVVDRLEDIETALKNENIMRRPSRKIKPDSDLDKRRSIKRLSQDDDDMEDEGELPRKRRDYRDDDFDDERPPAKRKSTKDMKHKSSVLLKKSKRSSTKNVKGISKKDSSDESLTPDEGGAKEGTTKSKTVKHKDVDTERVGEDEEQTPSQAKAKKVQKQEAGKDDSDEDVDTRAEERKQKKAKRDSVKIKEVDIDEDIKRKQRREQTKSTDSYDDTEAPLVDERKKKTSIKDRHKIREIDQDEDIDTPVDSKQRKKEGTKVRKVESDEDVDSISQDSKQRTSKQDETRAKRVDDEVVDRKPGNIKQKSKKDQVKSREDDSDEYIDKAEADGKQKTPRDQRKKEEDEEDIDEARSEDRKRRPLKKVYSDEDESSAESGKSRHPRGKHKPTRESDHEEEEILEDTEVVYKKKKAKRVSVGEIYSDEEVHEKRQQKPKSPREQTGRDSEDYETPQRTPILSKKRDGEEVQTQKGVSEWEYERIDEVPSPRWKEKTTSRKASDGGIRKGSSQVEQFSSTLVESPRERDKRKSPRGQTKEEFKDQMRDGREKTLKEREKQRWSDTSPRRTFIEDGNTYIKHKRPTSSTITDDEEPEEDHHIGRPALTGSKLANMKVAEALQMIQEDMVNIYQFVDQRFEIFGHSINKLKFTIRAVQCPLNCKMEEYEIALNEHQVTLNQLSQKVTFLVDNMGKDDEMMDRLILLEEDFLDLQHKNVTLWEERKLRKAITDNLQYTVEHMKNTKADKEDVEDALLDKVDKCMLEPLVTQAQLKDVQDNFVGNVQDSFNQLKNQVMNWSLELAQLEAAISKKLDADEMEALKEHTNTRLKSLHDKITKMSVMKDTTEAAGAKSKFIRNITCLSCDKEVMMRKEPDSVSYPKPAALPGGRSMGAYLAYELDYLRKHQKCAKKTKNLIAVEQAILGGKVEKPETDHICNRYCGGSFTTTTPEQRVARVGHFLNQWDPDNFPVTDSGVRGTDGKVYKGRAKETTKKDVDKNAEIDSKEKLPKK